MFPFIIVVWSWLKLFADASTQRAGFLLWSRPQLGEAVLLLAKWPVNHITSDALPLTSVGSEPTDSWTEKWVVFFLALYHHLEVRCEYDILSLHFCCFYFFFRIAKYVNFYTHKSHKTDLIHESANFNQQLQQIYDDMFQIKSKFSSFLPQCFLSFITNKRPSICGEVKLSPCWRKIFSCVW